VAALVEGLAYLTIFAMTASQGAQTLVFAAALVSLVCALEAGCPSTGYPSEGLSLLQHRRNTSALRVDEGSGGSSVDVLDCKFEHSGPHLLEADSFKYGDCVTESGTTYYMFAEEAVSEIMPGEIADLELEEDQDNKLADGISIYHVVKAFYHDAGPKHITSTDIQLIPNTSALLQEVPELLSASEDPEYVIHTHSGAISQRCPSGYRTCSEIECRVYALTVGLQFKCAGYHCGTPPGCQTSVGSHVYFNRKMTWKRGTEVCIKDRPPPEVIGGEAKLVEEFCPAHQYTGKIMCDDGTAVAAGECCKEVDGENPENVSLATLKLPGWGRCPSNCQDRQRMYDGYKVVCRCHGCANQRRSELSDAAAFLKAHNYLRCLHGHPQLSWDDKVAENAQTSAQQSWNAGELKHSDSYSMTPRAGENMGLGQSTPEEVVAAWYNELVQYGYNGEGDLGMDCKSGHYTAMIWKDSKKLGCGWIGGDSTMLFKGFHYDSAKVWVCQYADTAPNKRGFFR
jgi:hypothetical protein